MQPVFSIIIFPVMVRLIGIEAAGKGIETGFTSATIGTGSSGGYMAAKHC